MCRQLHQNQSVIAKGMTIIAAEAIAIQLALFDFGLMHNTQANGVVATCAYLSCKKQQVGIKRIRN